MFTTRKLASVTAIIVAAVSLAGCSAAAESADTAGSETITISTNLGETTIPANPERVVALDNTGFETLRDWGITPVALPKDLLPAEGFEDWLADESILNIGTHREPNLELVSEAAPDLIIGGYRFASYQDDLASIATTIDIAASVDAEGGYVESLKTQTETLGAIFDKPAEADALITQLTDAEAAAVTATNGESVFLAIVNGGKIDNAAERIGRIIEPLNLVDVFAGEAGDVHGDSGLSPETIAQANPDWVIVMDRDAAAGEAGASPAAAVFAAQEAFATTSFTTEGHIIYLDPSFYTTEGIQAYTSAYTAVVDAFTAGH